MMVVVPELKRSTTVTSFVVFNIVIDIIASSCNRVYGLSLKFEFYVKTREIVQNIWPRDSVNG